MKKTTNIAKILSLVAFFITLTISPAHAQQHQNGRMKKADNERPGRENIEAQKIAFITDKVGLTPAEAKEFWPVYNEYDAKRKEIRKQNKNNFVRDDDELGKLTEKEAEQIIENQMLEAQKMLDLRKEYNNKFKSILSATKVLKLYDAEKDFQKVMIDKLRSKKINKAPMPPAPPAPAVKPGK